MAKPKPKPTGYWREWENVERELKRVMKADGGVFPSQKRLKELGMSSVAAAIQNYHGGFRTVRAEFGVGGGTTDPELLKDLDWVMNQLYEIAESDKGQFPTSNRLVDIGRRDLKWGIYKYHGGMKKVRSAMGFEQVVTSTEKLRDWGWVSGELEGIVECNEGEFPTQNFLRNIGRSDLVTAISRHHGGFGAVQRQMGYEPKLTRPEQLADWEYIKGEIEAIMAENDGVFPSRKYLMEIGRSGLTAAIQKYHGGTLVVRKKLDAELQINSPETLASWDWVEAQIREIMEGNGGNFPTQAVLTETGRSDIKHAIRRYHGGFHAVRDKMGVGQAQLRKGQAKSWDWLRGELDLLIKDNEGEFPTTDYLTREGRMDVVGAISRHHGGMKSVRDKMGYGPVRQSKEDLQNWDWMEGELQEVISGNDGMFPTQKYLWDIGRSDLQNAIHKYHGGMNAAREKMGYGRTSADSELTKSWDWICKEIGAIMEEHDTNFPSHGFLSKNGRNDLVHAIRTYHGGFKAARSKYGEGPARREDKWWEDESAVLQESEAAIRALGYDELPPQKILASNGYSHIVRAAQHYGGMIKLREKVIEHMGGTPESQNLESLLDTYATGGSD